jgi:hypothetical protein
VTRRQRRTPDEQPELDEASRAPAAAADTSLEPAAEPDRSRRPAGWGGSWNVEMLGSEPRALEAQVSRHADGWEISLPLRIQTVSVEKRVVVAEEVKIHRHEVSQTQRVQASRRRERLRIDTYGPATPQVTRRPARARRATPENPGA